MSKTVFKNSDIEIEVTESNGEFRAKVYKVETVRRFGFVFLVIPWFKKTTTRRYIATSTHNRASGKWSNSITDHAYDDLIYEAFDQVEVDYDDMLVTMLTVGFFTDVITGELDPTDIYAQPFIYDTNYVDEEIFEESIDDVYYEDAGIAPDDFVESIVDSDDDGILPTPEVTEEFVNGTEDLADDDFIIPAPEDTVEYDTSHDEVIPAPEPASFDIAPEPEPTRYSSPEPSYEPPSYDSYDSGSDYGSDD